MNSHPSFRHILYETDKLRLEHEYEATYLIEKKHGTILLEDDFYGDPDCGLIDQNNQWAMMAGEHLTIWTPNKAWRIEHEDLRWIADLRVKDNETVEILIDPWSEKSSIWEINTTSFVFKKIRDFDDYRDQEYTDDVVW